MGRSSSDHPPLALAPATGVAPSNPAPLPPGLSACPRDDRPTRDDREAGRQRREETDAVVRELVRLALSRTGPSAVARHLGLARSRVEGFRDDGLAITLRDILAAPRSFGRDVLETALQVVLDDVPDTTAGLDQLATRLLLAVTDLLRAVDQGSLPGGDLPRRTVLAVLDQVDSLSRQIRRRLQGTPSGNPPAPPAPRPSPSTPTPNP